MNIKQQKENMWHLQADNSYIDSQVEFCGNSKYECKNPKPQV